MTSGAPILLFNRALRLVVAPKGSPTGIEIKDLRVAFSVSKTLKPEPNTAEIKIWNLNGDHRSQLEQLPTALVTLEAGYVAGTSLLFSGELRTSLTVREGPDLITTLASADGEKAHRTARVNVAIKKGMPADKVIKEVAKALGVTPGNLDAALSKIKASPLRTLFSEGTVVTGQASREMTALCRSCGLVWSIQDGKLQLLGLREALEGSAILLAPSTGLIGSPTVDNEGVLSVRTLIIPDLIPGRKIVVESERLKGQYRVETTQHAGDNGADDWYVDVEAKRY